MKWSENDGTIDISRRPSVQVLSTQLGESRDHNLTSKWPEKESDPYNTDKKRGSKAIRTTRYCRS